MQMLTCIVPYIRYAEGHTVDVQLTETCCLGDCMKTCCLEDCKLQKAVLYHSCGLLLQQPTKAGIATALRMLFVPVAFELVMCICTQAGCGRHTAVHSKSNTCTGTCDLCRNTDVARCCSSTKKQAMQLHCCFGPMACAFHECYFGIDCTFKSVVARCMLLKPSA